MTAIESIRFMINDCEMTDSMIHNLIENMGYNGAIKYIAIAQRIKISQMPTSVNDGANSFSWQDRVKGLDEIIRMADKYEFQNPEEPEDYIPKAWTSDLAGGNEDDGRFI